MKKSDQENIRSLFQPTFGNRPEQYIGRDGVIEQFMAGLREPVGSRNRCTLFLGQRGMGKTALLLELGDRASKAGYVVARVTAHEGMPNAIIEQFQLNGSPYFEDEKRKLTGVTAGALGFSFGLTFSEATERQYGFRVKMSLLCDKLAEKGKGALILIDEVRTSAAMRDVAASYQELVGDRKNIAIAMAGLPHAVSSVLNDSVLTFLMTTANLQTALGKKGPAIQPYRKRLIESGIIEAPRRGELVFAVPYLSDYLLED